MVDREEEKKSGVTTIYVICKIKSRARDRSIRVRVCVQFDLNDAMKRPCPPSSAPSKKQKKSPRISESLITSPEGEHNDQLVDTSWEKVKKRKQKKAERRDAKLDVCVLFDIPLAWTFHEKAHTSHRRIRPVFCIHIPRSSSVEMPSASMYRTVSSLVLSIVLTIANRMSAILSFTSSQTRHHRAGSEYRLDIPQPVPTFFTLVHP